MSFDKSGKALDRELALIHVDGDVELLSELAMMFLQDYARLIGDSRRSITELDCPVLERLAHTLRGRLAFFGIRNLQDQCMELEKMGRDKDLSRAMPLLLSIESGLEPVLPEFRELAQNAPGDMPAT